MTGRPLIIALLLLLLVPAGALAHSPSDIILDYDPVAQLLDVTITHVVPDPGSHFVKHIVISKNGEVVNSSTYTSQPDPNTFTYRFPIAAVPKDRLSVTASCSISGELSKTLDVPAPAATTSIVPTTHMPPNPDISIPPSLPVTTAFPATRGTPQVPMTRASLSVLPLLAVFGLLVLIRKTE